MPSESGHGPRNAFAIEFLARLDELAEPEGAHEADAAGPWAVRPVPYRGGTGFAVLREWESLDAGDVPCAVFRRRETALLAAAVLPATGREPIFRLDLEADAGGFPLRAAGEGGLRTPPPPAPPPSAPPSPQTFPATTESAGAPGEPAGHLRDFDEGLAEAMHLAAALVRSPIALARLLEAAGYVALEQAGRILDRRIS